MIRSLAGVRVLVVDDDGDTLELVRAVLEREAAVVSSAPGAEDGWRQFRRRPPHVLLVDISMPGRDGYWLMAQVRSLPDPLGGRVPSAAFTAHADERTREQVLGAGFLLHLVKPLEPGRLVEAVASLAGWAR